MGIAEFHNDPGRVYFGVGPPWVDEVAAWRRDPAYVIQIWPNGWVVDMNARGPVDH